MDNVNLAAVFAVALQSFPNDKLIALDNTIHRIGYVPAENLAFALSVERKIIKPNGSAWDLEALRLATSYEVNRRVAADEWRRK